MPSLVTLDEVKDFIRLDHDEHDVLLTTMISAASEAVLDVATAWDGEGTVPDRIKLAVLTRVGLLYDKADQTAGKGELAFLTPLRTLEV